ncbi:MAG: PEP-CTERM sorting domain-containing protein [Phycisphaeraceae bacterium]
MLKLIPIASAALALSLGAGTSHAAFELSDENSVLAGDVTTGEFDVEDFVVDGVDQLFSHTLSYSVDGQPQASFGTLDVVTERTGTLNTDFDGSGEPDNLFATFADPDGRFNIEVNNRLEGGQPGSGVADLAQQIQVNNTSSGDLEFSLFYFANYDIAGDFLGDAAIADNANTIVQSDGDQFVETVFTPAGAIDISQTIFVPFAIGEEDDSSGDTSWTLQWDTVIQEGGTFNVSLDTRAIVPEPGTMVLFVTGLLLTGRGLRRPRKR